MRLSSVGSVMFSLINIRKTRRPGCRLAAASTTHDSRGSRSVAPEETKKKIPLLRMTLKRKM